MPKVKPERMLAEERRRKIREILDRDERVTVSDLVERFAISAVTARTDLHALAQMGAAIRSHGGAIKVLPPASDFPLSVKQTLHQAEKRRIGRAAAELVRANQTIILDSGTTTIEVARHLKASPARPLTVITNALNIVMEIAAVPQVSMVMLGGIVRPVSMSLVGPHAEQTLRDLNADHLFLAVDGFDPEVGPSTPDILEAKLNALMMKVSREVTVVADSSKFHRRSLSVISKVDAIQRVITDNGVSKAVVAVLRSRGIEVICV